MLAAGHIWATEYRNVAMATEEMNSYFYLLLINCRAFPPYSLTGGCARGRQIPCISGQHPARSLVSENPGQGQKIRVQSSGGKLPLCQELASSRQAPLGWGSRQGIPGHVPLAHPSPASLALVPRDGPSL